MNLQGLYFITDRNLSKNGVIADVEAAIRGGCNVIQYREKDREYENIETEIERIRKITKEAGILFIVNDYVDLAQKYDADGVHVGQEDTEYQEARRILGPDKLPYGKGGPFSIRTVQDVVAKKRLAGTIGTGYGLYEGAKYMSRNIDDTDEVRGGIDLNDSDLFETESRIYDQEEIASGINIYDTDEQGNVIQAQ